MRGSLIRFRTFPDLTQIAGRACGNIFLCARFFAPALHVFCIIMRREDADKPCFVKMAQSKTLDSVAAKAVHAFQDGTRIFPGKIMDS